MPDIELQDIRFVRWSARASSIGEMIDFFNGGCVSVLYKMDSGVLRLEAGHAGNIELHSLICNDYLVYSPQTGYQVVNKEMFDTFVKTK